MREYEKESFYKNFFVFFSLLELLLILLFFELLHTKTETFKQELFKSMLVCSYTMDCKKFDYEFSPKGKQKENELYQEGDLYALFAVPNSKKFSIKLNYPKSSFEKDIAKIKSDLLLKFLFSSLILFIVALVFTLYSLKPIREALKLNDEFAKDILHDFNTPITSMKINLEMLKDEVGKNRFVDQISHSIDNILLLQNNLKSFIDQSISPKELVDIPSIVCSRVEFIKNIYPKIEFSCSKVKSFKKCIQKELLIRVIDNLLSNAAKYNKSDGQVKVSFEQQKIIIEDTGKGIKDIKRATKRYYKEQNRGLGLGLDIVTKLCKDMGIDFKIESKVNEGTKIELDLHLLKGSC